jgi:predicted exporter
MNISNNIRKSMFDITQIMSYHLLMMVMILVVGMNGAVYIMNEANRESSRILSLFYFSHKTSAM